MVEADQSRDGEAGTTMSPLTLDGLASRGTSEYPSLMELKDEKGECSNSWIPFENAVSPRPPQVEVLRSNEQECVVTITTHGMYSERVKVDDKEFEKLTIPKHGLTNEIGKPQLPVIRGLIEIPLGKHASLTINTLRSLEFLNCTIYSAQKPTPESREGANEDVFQFDQAFYSIDAYYPHLFASVSSPAQLRDHTVVQLSVYPVRFNPAINCLNVSASIEIKLEYYNVNKTQITRFNRFSSPAFEEICKTAIWNYDFSKPKSVEAESVGYLVISNDTFYSSMHSFVEWKTANGFNVTSVKLSDVGKDANDTDIYNYLYTAYHNWTTPPVYVLLVGDVEYLPTHYGLDHPYEDRKTATDHYYACVSGSDYLPDLFVGRLSVESVLELNNTLNKLTGYNSFFNKRATVISDYQEGRPFEETSNWIYAFLREECYTVDKLYESSGTATTSNIAGVLNEGRAIINYRGHGGPTGWATGPFYNSHVLGLNNEGKLPIVISTTCSTGEYDYASDCFGETWMKAQGKGAVAFWGSSRVSYSGYNDELSKGVYKAIVSDSLCEFGPITVKAKLYMYNYYGDGFYTHLQYEMYNILTDPQLHTSAPAYEHELCVNVDAPGHLEPGNSSLLNATVYNCGLSNETDVVLSLLINGTTVVNTTIAELVNGMCYTINHTWTPTVEGIYNVTAYAPPVPGENITANNWYTKFVRVRYVVMIGIIETHGETLHGELLAGYYTSLGHIVEKITTTITPGVLDDYDIVIVGEFGSDWLSSEIDAVEAFIDSGKAFVAIGDQLDTSVQEILGTYGISCTGINAPGGSSSNFDPFHPIMQNVSLIYASSPVDSLQIATPACWIANDISDTYTLIAGAEVGGYVLCLSDDFAADLYTDDNEIMFKNIVDWMTVKYEHELVVRLDTPDLLMPGDSWLLSATVCNRGLNNETNVELFLMINDTVVNNATIHKLVNGTCYTIDYLWTPPVEAVYNVIAYAPPVSGENVTINNVMSRLVYVGLFPSDQPVVYVNPHIVTAVIGETFTVAVNLFNVTEPFSNLYGFDIKFAWNPAIIEYVNHTITVPVEEYPEGVLHKPIIPIIRTVESDHVQFVYASMLPAEPFNNPNESNSIFLITFKVVGEGTSKLSFTSVKLANVNGQPIVHTCIDGLVTASPTVHDVAVLNVSSCADTVYTGRTVNITVLAANEGNATETFNITLYANSTVIGVQTPTLYQGENTTLTFTWNTTGFAKGNYTINAYAWPVPGETDLTDNTYVDGKVLITIAGDIDGDGDVDYMDLFRLARAYGSTPDDPNWDADADLNGDNKIDYRDLFILARNYGKTIA